MKTHSFLPSAFKEIPKPRTGHPIQTLENPKDASRKKTLRFTNDPQYQTAPVQPDRTAPKRRRSLGSLIYLFYISPQTPGAHIHALGSPDLAVRFA